MRKEKKKDTSLPTWKETFAFTWRAVTILWQIAPRQLTSCMIYRAVNGLRPYVPMYFTARLLSEIAGNRDPNRLWLLLWLLLGSSMLLFLLVRGLYRWNIAEDEAMFANWNRLFFTKMLDMDFCDIDNPAMQTLYTQILHNDNWNSWGLRHTYHHTINYTTDAAARILGAAALTVSLFLQPVPAGSSLAWMNRPWCLLGMLALLAAALVVSPALANKANAYYANWDMTQINREFSFFGSIAMDERFRNTDIRTYQQDKFFRAKVSGFGGGFGRKSVLARDCAGPMGLLYAASEAVNRMFSGVIYLFVGLKALGGAFSVGMITQYVGALEGLTGGVSELLQQFGDMRANAKFLRPSYELLDTPNKMYQGSLTTEKRSDRNYEIEFRDVSFKYPGTDTWALRHASMKFRVGERLAVVGENGSGKTTFIKLLCRLYDPTEGTILLNGIDIRKYNYKEYMDLFSVVFQDFKLLSQPLGQNVAASIEYDRERAAECLKKAGFDKRLSELPKGLDTCLYRDFEEDGVEISGGEAQKIALARVLYRDAPFIVLDEPTAALDPEAEAEVYTRFNDIVEDKTAIYISHRLSSCRFCDEIAVFDHGQIVQQGTHDALVAKRGGKYQALWDAQAQYYQKESA